MTLTTLKSRDLLTIPASALSRSAGDLKSLLVDPRALGILPVPSGGSRGYNASGDVLAQLADGTDLNDLWNEYQASLDFYNARRQNLIDLITFGVTQNIEQVAIPGGEQDFERATEFGEPVGIRTGVAYQELGYDFQWFDLAIRFTWMFLAEAAASQVDSLNNAAMNADIRLLFRKTMEAVFRNVTRSGSANGQALSVYPFYNGDGWIPPRFKNYEHDGTHSHFLTSGAAQIDSGDLDAMIAHLRHHGYGDTPGAAQIILLINEAQAAPIRAMRVANGDSYDFIPPTGTMFPRYLLADNMGVDGGQPPQDVGGIEVVGQYGPIIVLQESWIPAGYTFAFATGGTENPDNPVGIREHTNASLRGLRLVKGRTADYPLIDSFYQRGFGTGVRHRGNGVVMQITANAEYAVPAEYTNVA